MKRFSIYGLFLGSYAPLFLLLLITQYNNHVLGRVSIAQYNFNILPLAFAVLGLIGLLFIFSFLALTKSISPIKITIEEIERNSHETLAYLITYLIPFVGFSFVARNFILANALIFVFIGMLYVQSNMIFLNPTLGLFGYKVYKIKTKEHNMLMLAKNDIEKQTKVKVIAISKGIVIES